MGQHVHHKWNAVDNIFPGKVENTFSGQHVLRVSVVTNSWERKKRQEAKMEVIMLFHMIRWVVFFFTIYSFIPCVVGFFVVKLERKTKWKSQRSPSNPANVDFAFNITAFAPVLQNVVWTFGKTLIFITEYSSPTMSVASSSCSFRQQTVTYYYIKAFAALW